MSASSWKSWVEYADGMAELNQAGMLEARNAE